MKNDSEKLTALIVGSGRIAGEIEGEPLREVPCTHAGAYTMHPQYKLCGFVDVIVDKAEKLSSKFKVDYFSDSIEEALKNIRPDILSICVPYKNNLTVIREVLTYFTPKSIFLEKPISDNAVSGSEIVRLCRDAGSNLFVNNRRLFSASTKVKELLTMDESLKPISITAWCTSGLYAMGIHMIDLMRFYCGDVLWVVAEEEKEKVDYLPYSTNFKRSDFSASALIGFKNGITGHFINTSLTAYQYNEIVINGKQKRLMLTANGSKILLSEMLPPGQTTVSYKLDTDMEIEVKKRPLFINFLDEILRVKDGESPVSGIEGSESLKCIEAIRLSAKEKRRVFILEEFS